MFFAAPYMLLLLPLLAVALVPWRASERRRPRRGRSAGALRFTAGVLLIAALSQPVVERAERAAWDVLIADVSASVAPEAVRTDAPTETATAAPPSVQRRRIAFAAAPRVVRAGRLDVGPVPISTRSTEPQPRRWADAGGLELGQTDIAAALDLADAMVPTGAPATVTVVTDGWATTGDTARAALRLVERGRDVRFVASPVARGDGVALVAASLPASVGLESDARVTVTLVAARAASVRLSVEDAEGRLVHTADLDVRAGWQTFDVRFPARPAGAQVYTLRCAADGDRVAENDVRRVATWVRPAYRVEVLEADPREPATAALRRVLGVAATCRRVDPQAVAARGALGDADVLVLANTSAEALPATAQAALREAVADGAGLLVTGGPASFGAGGYAQAPLAVLLPVDLADTVERRDPSVTLVVIIDTSGSMKGPRFDLARETARLAIQRLEPHDQCGIVEFYGAKRWAARIQSAGNAIEIQRALNRLSAGGGTVILPALEEAYYALLNVHTRLKHVLILTDGGVETGPFQEVVTRMAETGMTVSTVMVGPGQHSGFLQDLAQWGRGRFYSAADLFSLPEIIVKQPEQRAPGAVALDPVRLARAGPQAVLEGIDWSAAPRIGGHNRGQARPTADALVTTEGGEPLLARWRWGRGIVAALLTDVGGPWAAELWAAPAGATLLRNVLRELAETTAGDALRVTMAPRPAGLEVDVVAVGATTPPRAEPLRLIVHAGTDQPPATRVVSPLEPGRWNTLLTARPGLVTVEARGAHSGATGRGAVFVNERPERAAPLPNTPELEALAELTRQARRPASGAYRVYTELWPWCALAALACMLLQLLIRRWPRALPVPAALLGLTLLAGMPVQAFATSPEGGGELAIAAPPTATPPARGRSDSADPRGAPPQTSATNAAVLRLELQGEYEQAAELLVRAGAAASDPESAVRSALQRALLLHDLGDAAGCRAALQEAGAESLPSAPRRPAAVLAALLGHADLAVALLPPAPESSDWQLVAGLLLRRAGSTAAALTAFEQATLLAERVETRRFAAAQLAAAAKDGADAAARLDHWLAEPEHAPTFARVLFHLLWDQGRHEEAFELLTRVFEVDGEATNDAALYEEAVTLALEAERGDLAARVLRALLSRAPRRADLRGALARVWLAGGDRASAVALFEERLASAPGADELFALADAARALGLPDTAARLLAALPAQRAAQLRAALWRARDRRAAGDFSGAQAALEQAVTLAERDAETLQRVAQQFVECGAPTRASELLHDLFAATRDPQVGARLTWLLERQERPGDALKIWRTIWSQATSPALQQRASERVLTLAAETGQLADLAIELEQRLARGAATPAELDLLIELYTQLRDGISVSEILYLFAEQSGQRLDALQRLARAYVHMGRLGQADAVLRQLLAQDPQNAADYVQALAVLAVERQRPRDARHWATRLAETLGDPGLAAELTAGVYGLLELHEQAAAEYAAALAANPQRIELWLLWAQAQQAAGRADLAATRLLELLETPDDDLFLVAVDGLLNLDAGPAALQVARRRLLARIAAAPERTYLYDVAADVLDALGRGAEINALLELAAAFSVGQRGAIYRDMLTRARIATDVPRVIEYGNILVALDYAVPPDAYLELGRLLLERDRDAEAARAFQRAVALGDARRVRRDVAGVYEDALRPERAGALYDALLEETPDEAGLWYRYGATLEQRGRFAEAFDAYWRGLESLLLRIPSAGDAAATAPVDGRSQTRRMRRVAADVGEVQQYLDPLVDSLLSTAQTPEAQAALAALVRRRVESEMVEVAEPAGSGRSVASWPRLARAVSLARFVLIALHEVDAADALDERVLARFPEDVALRTHVVQTRLDWGLVERADRFVPADAAFERLPPAVAIHRVVGDAAALTHALEDPARIAAHGAELVRALVLLGQDDAAVAALDACAGSSQTRTPRSALDFLIACTALRDRERLERWWLLMPDACRTAPPGEGVAALRAAIRLGWHVARPEARRRFVDALATLASDAPRWENELDPLRVRLEVELGASPQATVALAERIVARATVEVVSIVELLHEVPAAARPDLLERAWASRPAAERLDLLLAVAGRYADVVDAGLADRFQRLLALSPPPRLGRHEPFRELTQLGWHENTLQPELGRRVAEYLLGRNASELPVQAACAAALHAASAPERAAPLANDVLAALLAGQQLGQEEARMLDAVVPVLPAEARRARAVELEAAEAAGRASIVATYVVGLLRASLGEDVPAVERLAAAFQRRPADPLVRGRLIDWCAATRQERRLIPLLAPHLGDAEVMQAWELSTLAGVLRDEGAHDAALAVLQHDRGPLAAMRALELEVLRGQETRALLLLRRFFITNRLERRFYAPLSPPSAGVGGLQGYRARQAVDETRRRYLLDDLAGLDGLDPALAGRWRCAAADRGDLPGLASARLATARRDGTTATLVREVTASVQAGRSHARDLHLLAGLSDEETLRLPQAALDALRLRMACGATPADLDLQWLADLYVRAGLTDAAAHILRWLVATDLATAHRNVDVDRLRAHRAAYLAALPDAAREPARQWLLEASLPTAADVLRDARLADVLALSLELGANATAEAYARILAAVQREAAPRYLPRLQRAGARVAALLGRRAEFDAHFEELLRLTPLAYGGTIPLDALEYLPAAGGPADPPGQAAESDAPGMPAVADRVAELAAQIHVARPAERLTAAQATEALVLLGAWCEANRRPDAARQRLAEAIATAGTAPAAHWLWWIDLARELDPARAREGAAQLLRAGLLPRGRIAPLLAEWAATRGADEADALLLESIASLYDPDLLARAEQAAARLGRPAARESLQQRVRFLKNLE